MTRVLVPTNSADRTKGAKAAAAAAVAAAVAAAIAAAGGGGCCDVRGGGDRWRSKNILGFRCSAKPCTL